MTITYEPPAGTDIRHAARKAMNLRNIAGFDTVILVWQGHSLQIPRPTLRDRPQVDEREIRDWAHSITEAAPA